MAEFSRLVITNKGQALLAKMMTGEADVEFTKISVSDKEYTLEELNMLTELTGVKQTAPVAKITRTNNVAITIETSFDNTELTQGYYMRALGLYAIDPDDGEILYAVTTELAGCCYMPAYNGITISGACIKLVTTVGNAENVSLEVDPGVYATVGEIKELRECVDGFETWKDNTQKRLDNWGPTIVGHGQVINSLRDSIGNLKPVATSGDYNDLVNKPVLKLVAMSGSYDDLINKPSIPAAVRVKGNTEFSYRTGDVNLTAENIGAINKKGDIVNGTLYFGNKEKELTFTNNGVIIQNTHEEGESGYRRTQESALELDRDHVKLTSYYRANSNAGLDFSALILSHETAEIRTYNRDGDDSYGTHYKFEFDHFSSINDDDRDSGGANLGTSYQKWNNIFAANGIIQTSDRNKKNTIEEMSAEKAELLIYGLKPSTFKMNNGTFGRTHWGMIAQDIEELLNEIEMDTSDFAGFIKSPKIQRITDDENGKELQKPIEKVIEGEYDYSLRYDEFIAPIIKVIQSQHEEIKTLKQETADLKRKMSDLTKKVV